MAERSIYDYHMPDGSLATADTLVTAWEPHLHAALDRFVIDSGERIGRTDREQMARLAAFQVARSRIFQEWLKLEAAAITANAADAGGTAPDPFDRVPQAQEYFMGQVVPELADRLTNMDWVRCQVPPGGGELVLGDLPVISWLGVLACDVQLYRSWGIQGIQVMIPLTPALALLCRDEPTCRELVGRQELAPHDVATLNLLQSRQADRWVIGATEGLGGLVAALRADPSRATQIIPHERLKRVASQLYPRGLDRAQE